MVPEHCTRTANMSFLCHRLSLGLWVSRFWSWQLIITTPTRPDAISTRQMPPSPSCFTISGLSVLLRCSRGTCSPMHYRHTRRVVDPSQRLPIPSVGEILLNCKIYRDRWRRIDGTSKQWVCSTQTKMFRLWGAVLTLFLPNVLSHLRPNGPQQGRGGDWSSLPDT
jgi:hypothetical protein